MKFSKPSSKVTGNPSELKKIRPKPPEVMDSGRTENIPCDFNREGRGGINTLGYPLSPGVQERNPHAEHMVEGARTQAAD